MSMNLGNILVSR